MSARDDGGRSGLVRARPVAGLIDVSIGLLLRHPGLLIGLALRSALPAGAAVVAALGLIHVRPQWAGAGVLPILAGVAAGFVLWRGVTAGAIALAVQDLSAGSEPSPGGVYLIEARSQAHRLVPGAAGAAVLLLLAPLFLGLTPLLAPTWMLASGPLAATGQRPGGLRWAQGGRAIHVLALLALGWVWMTINLAIGPAVAVYLTERLLAIDLTWWGRLVQPTHALWLEIAVVGGWVLVEPIAQVAGAAFALDLRVRREGLDLKRLVAAAATGIALLMVAPASAPAAQPPGEVALQEALDRVYARPEFGQAEKGPAAESLSDLLERFWTWLKGLFEVDPVTPPTTGCDGDLPGREASAGGWAKTLALLAAFLALLGLGLALTRLIEARRMATRAEVAQPPSTPEALRRTPRAWLSDADRLAAEGQLAEALRLALLALLAALHRARAIDYDEARTNGEYVADLRQRRPTATPPYLELVGLFDRAWYGGKPVGAEDWRRGRAAAHAALQGEGD